MKLDKARIFYLRKQTERLWVEEDKSLNLLNYWFYRYFTNRYVDWLMLNIDYNFKRGSHFSK